MQNKKLENQVTILILATNEEAILEETIKIILDENKFYINKIFIITPKNLTTGCLDTVNKIKYNHRNLVIHKFQPPEFPGYGGASIYGINLVESDYFILLDADGETDPKEVKSLINNIDNSKYEIISCSRWLAKSWINQYGILNYILNWLFQRIASLLFLSKLTDYTVGYRIYPTKLMKEINFKNFNQSFSLESILIPLRKGFRIKEIPYNFIKRSEGASKNSFLNKLKYVKTLLECRLRKIN